MKKIILTIAIISLAALGCNNQPVENTNTEANTSTEPARFPIPQSKLEIKIDGSPEVVNETHIETVKVASDPQGTFLRIKLNPEGTQILAKMTTDNIGKEIPIKIDGELISSPTVQTPITEGAFLVSTGNFTPESALKLKEKLQGYQEVPADVKK